MMLLQSPTQDNITAQRVKESRYARSIKAKTLNVAAKGCLSTSACGRPTTSNIAGVVVEMMTTAFVLPDYSLSQLFGDCKYLGDMSHFYYLYGVERKF